MSTLRNPVGPKDRKVYIRRRLVVLAILLAIVAVIVLLIVKPGSSGGVQGAREVEVPSDLAETTGGAESGGDADAEVVACSSGQLVVEPLTDQADYAPGVFPELSMSIENTGDRPCSADLGTAAMEFTLTSGDDEVWRSTDCQVEAEHLMVELEPGKPLETEPLVWDRTRSSPETCEITRDPVSFDGSSYHLRVSAGGVQSDGTRQFLLY